MPDTSRPMCQLVEWCALGPHPESSPCSLIRPIPPYELDPASVDRFVAGVAAAVTKAGIRANLALAPQPAVGGTMESALLDDVDELDPGEWQEAIVKARSAADEYQAIAVELTDLVSRYRGLKSRQVTYPGDHELTAPALLGSSLVKLDMTVHLTRLEQFQVAAMGYAGAWHLLGDAWENELEEAIAAGEKRRREAALKQMLPEDVRRCRICQCTDDEACPDGCAWVEQDLCSECVPPSADAALKTPDEWCVITGIKIVDPDGWRGASGRPFTDPISEAEFQRRVSVSTTNSRVLPDDDRD